MISTAHPSTSTFTISSISAPHHPSTPLRVTRARGHAERSRSMSDNKYLK